jgi:hypothetical protein
VGVERSLVTLENLPPLGEDVDDAKRTPSSPPHRSAKSSSEKAVVSECSVSDNRSATCLSLLLADRCSDNFRSSSRI